MLTSIMAMGYTKTQYEESLFQRECFRGGIGDFFYFLNIEISPEGKGE